MQGKNGCEEPLGEGH